MNNSITKLKDFELDEISGGITAKQVGAYAIKGTCATVSTCVALGIEYFALVKTRLKCKLYIRCNKALGKEKKRTNRHGTEHTYCDDTILSDSAYFSSCGAIFGIPAAVACIGGLKLGEWLCKKLNLED